ncbi:MAG: peroxiredoxin [bacterium]|nr:peroxiredoxin [bacterium]
MIATGKKVKDHKVTITNGEEHKLSSFVGKKGLIVYFYPRDSTPGCTKEACSFRDNHSKLKRMGYGVVGVSLDSVKSHQKFAEKQELNFPLIADESREVSEAFGTYGEKKMYGKTFMGLVRSTFVLDEKLKVLIAYEKVKVDGHVDQIIADIKNIKAQK